MKKMLLLCTTLVLISSCNTMQGAGQDIQTAGQGLANAAHKAKEKMNEPQPEQ